VDPAILQSWLDDLLHPFISKHVSTLHMGCRGRRKKDGRKMVYYLRHQVSAFPDIGGRQYMRIWPAPNGIISQVNGVRGRFGHGMLFGSKVIVGVALVYIEVR